MKPRNEHKSCGSIAYSLLCLSTGFSLWIQKRFYFNTCSVEQFRVWSTGSQWPFHTPEIRCVQVCSEWGNLCGFSSPWNHILSNAFAKGKSGNSLPVNPPIGSIPNFFSGYAQYTVFNLNLHAVKNKYFAKLPFLIIDLYPLVCATIIVKIKGTLFREPFSSLLYGKESSVFFLLNCPSHLYKALGRWLESQAVIGQLAQHLTPQDYSLLMSDPFSCYHLSAVAVGSTKAWH